MTSTAKSIRVKPWLYVTSDGAYEICRGGSRWQAIERGVLEEEDGFVHRKSR